MSSINTKINDILDQFEREYANSQDKRIKNNFKHTIIGIVAKELSDKAPMYIKRWKIACHPDKTTSDFKLNGELQISADTMNRVNSLLSGETETGLFFQIIMEAEKKNQTTLKDCVETVLQEDIAQFVRSEKIALTDEDGSFERVIQRFDLAAWVILPWGESRYTVSTAEQFLEAKMAQYWDRQKQVHHKSNQDLQREIIDLRTYDFLDYKKDFKENDFSPTIVQVIERAFEKYLENDITPPKTVAYEEAHRLYHVAVVLSEREKYAPAGLGLNSTKPIGFYGTTNPIKPNAQLNSVCMVNDYLLYQWHLSIVHILYDAPNGVDSFNSDRMSHIRTADQSHTNAQLKWFLNLLEEAKTEQTQWDALNTLGFRLETLGPSQLDRLHKMTISIYNMGKDVAYPIIIDPQDGKVSFKNAIHNSIAQQLVKPLSYQTNLNNFSQAGATVYNVLSGTLGFLTILGLFSSSVAMVAGFSPALALFMQFRALKLVIEVVSSVTLPIALLILNDFSKSTQAADLLNQKAHYPDIVNRMIGLIFSPLYQVMKNGTLSDKMTATLLAVLASVTFVSLEATKHINAVTTNAIALFSRVVTDIPGSLNQGLVSVSNAFSGLKSFISSKLSRNASPAPQNRNATTTSTSTPSASQGREDKLQLALYRAPAPTWTTGFSAAKAAANQSNAPEKATAAATAGNSHRSTRRKQGVK